MFGSRIASEIKLGQSEPTILKGGREVWHHQHSIIEHKMRRECIWDNRGLNCTRVKYPVIHHIVSYGQTSCDAASVRNCYPTKPRRMSCSIQAGTFQVEGSLHASLKIIQRAIGPDILP